MNPFDHVTTADFEGSSARDDRKTQSLPFDDWVAQYLETARIGYEASEGGIDPWVVLVRPTKGEYHRRLFTPEADETNTDFFSRVQREARSMKANQVFVAMISRSTYSHDEKIPTAGDIGGRFDEFDPIFEESIIWYAESPALTRYGMIPVHLGRTGEAVENQDESHDGASPFFVGILR